MQLSIATYQQGSLSLAAPLAANINHQGTVFGGSLNAAATLCGWGLLLLELNKLNLKTNIVIQRSHTEYRLPVSADFTVHCTLNNAAMFIRFVDRLKKRKIARIELTSYIKAKENIALDFTGIYVVTLCGS